MYVCAPLLLVQLTVKAVKSLAARLDKMSECV